MGLRDATVTLLVPLAASLLLALPAFDWLEGDSLDLQFWLRNSLAPPQAEVGESPAVVVAIDEDTYRRPPFDTLPTVFWSQHIGAVVDSLVEADAAAIGFDLILATSVEPMVRRYDRPLRAALRRAALEDKVLLGSATVGGQAIEPMRAYQLVVGPHNVRPLNLTLDKDGVVRRMPLLFPGETSGGAGDPTWVPSMALSLTARLLDASPSIDASGAITIGEVRIPGPGDELLGVSKANDVATLPSDLTVDLYRGPTSFPTYSLADLFHCAEAGDKDFFRRHFAGKAVILGTVTELDDRKLTSLRFALENNQPVIRARCATEPFEDADPQVRTPSGQLLPGIYLHAAVINNLTLGQTLLPFTWSWQLAANFMMALAIALVALARSARASALCFLVGAGIWASVSTWVFTTGWILPLLPPIAAAGLTLAVLLGYRFAIVDRTERHIRQAFGRILAPALVERMVKERKMPTQGGEMREMTVWLSDLESYSTISEVLSPTELVDLLNQVYSAMSDTIEAHDGFVAQFVGDAVVAAFGVPVDDPDHAQHGVEAAMACCKRVEALREELTLPRGIKLRIRVGVSTGKLLVGYIGSQRRLSYSLVGDDINLASRLEGVNKVYGSTILVNGETSRRCHPDLVFREVDLVQVKGRDTPVQILEPRGWTKDVGPEERRLIERYEAALADYRARRFETAATSFEDLASEDPVSRCMAERARAFVAEPPPVDWDGVHVLLSK